MILAGDIGGTKTVLALFEAPHGQLTLVRDITRPSREFPSLEAIIRDFLGGSHTLDIAAACFGVAGAVIDGRCATTNLPWTLDEKTLSRDIPASFATLMASIPVQLALDPRAPLLGAALVATGTLNPDCRS